MIKYKENDRIEVNPTAVRAPVFYNHSEAVSIETEQPITAQEVIEILNKAPGLNGVQIAELLLEQNFALH